MIINYITYYVIPNLIWNPRTKKYAQSACIII